LGKPDPLAVFGEGGWEERRSKEKEGKRRNGEWWEEREGRTGEKRRRNLYERSWKFCSIYIFYMLDEFSLMQRTKSLASNGEMFYTVRLICC